MIAALILLNRLLALGAGFGISHNPVHVFTLRLGFEDPRFGLLTVARAVCFFRAKQANRRSTMTVDCGGVVVLRLQETAVATRVRAPFDVWVVVRERFRHPFPVQVHKFVIGGRAVVLMR